MGIPKHLIKGAGQYYKILYGLVEDIIEDGDENLLAVLANAYYHYDACHELIKERGLNIATTSMIRQNPAFKTQQECVKTIDRLSLHFGLSPKARGSKFVKVDKAVDEFEEL